MDRTVDSSVSRTVTSGFLVGGLGPGAKLAVGAGIGA